MSFFAASCGEERSDNGHTERPAKTATEKPVVPDSALKETEEQAIAPPNADTLEVDTPSLAFEEPPAMPVDTSVSEPDTSDISVEPFPEEDYSEPVPEYMEYAETDDIFYEADDYVETERLLTSEVVKVISPEPKSPKDSVLTVIEERLSLSNDEPSPVVIVEKWLSPVHFKGYRFNKKKLILYGASKSAKVHIYYYTNEHYLGLNQTIYYLDERIAYSRLETVKDSALIKYLNNYEHPL